MKKTITVAAVALLCTIVACTKNADTGSVTPAGTAGTGTGDVASGPNRAARMSGPNYSQSIPLDSANKMLGSYLGSVGYPTVDTTLRSLTFDADTLRAYLGNHNIVTLKFMLAHRLTYVNGHSGVPAGLNPGAVTLVLVGLDNSDHYVLNNRNGVYDNMGGCPQQCPGTQSAYILP